MSPAPRQHPFHLPARAIAILLLLLLSNAASPLALGSIFHHTLSPAPIPPEIASTHFTVALNGKTTPVVHAAANYYLLSFPIHKTTTVSVTADRDDFWARGVEVQPWRLGIRPEIHGRTITFRLHGPAKISITRPDDYLGDAEMLFLFADPEEHNAPRGPAPGLRFFGPGIHRENIDAHDGDRIYLAPGAVILGSLNVWQVHDVQVSGRGTVVYDGPQNPADDDGWMHKPNWHCIVMDNAHAISIEGLTCIVRSLTWMIQMKDSRDIHFRNLKVIGGSPGNANQDGMDWLGGGDTTVDDSFFRAADDIFALQGNWEGYGAAAFAIPGHDVTNIAITRSVLSTSISNVVRAAWPEKSFNSANISLSDSDVLHMGLGGCKVPFALLEIWADPNGTGRHTDYHLSNIRLEDWYSLLQLRQPAPAIDHVALTDIFALDQPSLVASTLLGSVHDTTLTNIDIAGHRARTSADIPVQTLDNAQPPTITSTGTSAEFQVQPGIHRPHDRVRFTAIAAAPSEPPVTRYEWTFGDGTSAHGRTPSHRFRDTAGTTHDGSGRFRVILHATNAQGHEAWAAHPVIITDHLIPALAPSGAREPGLQTEFLPEQHPDLDGPPGSIASAVIGTSSDFKPVAPPGVENYRSTFDGLLKVPSDGGYTFTLLNNDQGRLEIDGVRVATSPAPWPQVCGLRGNAVRPAKGSIALAAGPHRIHVAITHTQGDDGFAVLWQADDLPLAPIPASALSHLAPAPNAAATPHL